MSTRLRYPIGIQTFRTIREEGSIYVDKTGYIHKVLSEAKYVFLGRPRRFGKSLFLSTLEAYFLGQKELFEGLEVAKEETEWISYPVIHLDLSNYSSADAVPLGAKITRRLDKIATTYGLEVPLVSEIDGLVSEFIESLYEVTGKRVVVLVDEYDIPIHDIDSDSSTWKERQQVLRSLFLQLKASDRYIKFCFVTGVARFNQMSLFSAPNNFNDVSMNPKFAALCGFTKEEIEKYCKEGLEVFAKQENLTKEELLTRLGEHYDGYRFTRSDERVFNPLSIVYALNDSAFGNYWVRTGLTAVFVKKLTDPRFQLPKITSSWYDESSLSKIYDSSDPVSLMFQTGYLTISEYDNGDYRLKIPNQEVTEALTKDLIPTYARKDPGEMDIRLRELRRALFAGEINEIIDVLKSILAEIAYHMFPKENASLEQKENYYHSLVYLVFLMVKSYVNCEFPSNKGRADMVAQTDNFIYVFEFKVDGTIEEAFKQIEEKGYLQRYSHAGKKLYQIAVVFSSKAHDITSWACRPAE